MHNPINQAVFGSRDTASYSNEVLPAILNEDAFWPSEPKNLEEAGISEMLVET